MRSAVTISDGRSIDRKSTRLNSSHLVISHAVFCLKKKKPRFVYQPCPLGSSMSSGYQNGDVASSQWPAENGSVDISTGKILFFFNDPATTEIYPFSLHDALPIYVHMPPLLIHPLHDAAHFDPVSIEMSVRQEIGRAHVLNSSHLVISYAVFC